MRRTLILTALVLLIGGVQATFATPVLTLSSGAIEVSIVDGQVGPIPDLNPLPNWITYIGPVGPVWFSNVTTGVTHSPGALQDLNSVNSSNGPGELTITFVDSGFMIVYPQLTFDIGGTTSEHHLLTASAFVNDTLIGTLGPFGPGAFSGSVTGPGFVSMVPYTLKEQIVITAMGAGMSSFDASITPVPEPASLLLIGTGFAILGVLRLRKR